LAEAVARHKLVKSGMEKSVIVDSAGTHGYHIGDRPDPRTLKIAQQNSIPTEGIVARQVKMDDFDEFDLILAMDNGHLRHLQAMANPMYHHKVHLFLDYAEQVQDDVADPYYGDFEGFIEMYRVIDKATKNLEKWPFQKKI